MIHRCIVVAATALVLANAVALAAAPPPLTFTAEQSDAGRIDYIEDCAECHGGELEGQFGPALAGPNARDQYESPNYVYGYFSVAMPHGHPGQLTQEQYVDIMAYLLERHHRTPGTKALTAAAITADMTNIGP
jgi:mono/diheme cytochrome c family protein